MKPQIIRTQDFVDETAQAIFGHVLETLKHQQYCVMGLNGGGTPRPVYERLAAIEQIPWNRIVLTFGDERCVPPSHPDSNYAMVRTALLARIDIPSENVLRMKGEKEPHEAALEYERQLEDVSTRCAISEFKHDVLLLGLGDDGHTASLFPGTEALSEMKRRVVANYVPKFDAYRLTLTLPFINASKVILFMVNDAKKQGVVQQILDGTGEYPAGLVSPANGKTLWCIGNSGAAGLAVE